MAERNDIVFTSKLSVEVIAKIEVRKTDRGLQIKRLENTDLRNTPGYDAVLTSL